MTTISHIKKWKREQRKWAALTAYDATFARAFTEAGINVMLVGDSLGNTVQGHESTVPVTMEDMIYHTKCARRGAPKCFLLGDMPFMSYGNPTQACENAAALMQAGANMVKMEGGEWLCETVQILTTRGISVCGHIGLTPQSINVMGGYRIQGRDQAAADRLLSEALALEKAGAQMIRKLKLRTDFSTLILISQDSPIFIFCPLLFFIYSSGMCSCCAWGKNHESTYYSDAWNWSWGWM